MQQYIVPKQQLKTFLYLDEASSQPLGDFVIFRENSQFNVICMTFPTFVEPLQITSRWDY